LLIVTQQSNYYHLWFYLLSPFIFRFESLECVSWTPMKLLKQKAFAKCSFSFLRFLFVCFGPSFLSLLVLSFRTRIF
jgi:hypothetical protein